MRAPAGPGPGADAARPGPAGLRRWAAPAAQAVTLAVLLSLGLSTVLAARADLAADRGQGPRVAVQDVQRVVAPPVRLGIPSLDIATRLIGLRKDRTGQLQVPDDPDQAGWYSQGFAPGDDGPAVLVGHVDSFRGPGIFANLKSMKPGEQVRVRRADGSLAVFEVTQVKEYGKRDFPTEEVYVGNGSASLRLVTCGGEFDRSAGSYLSNVVVFAELVDVQVL